MIHVYGWKAHTQWFTVHEHIPLVHRLVFPMLAANDRADQRSAPVDGAFSYTTDGSGVDIYVLDSGINAAHDEFDTRVVTSLAANFDTTSTDTPAWADCNGHGTFVASQAAGNFVGVASGARIIPVRVFNCAGQATLASLVSAVDYMIGTAGNQTGRKAVINFSGGGGAFSVVSCVALRGVARFRSAPTL